MPLLALLGTWEVDGLDNGLGLTPIMGYNTWDDFRCDHITATNIQRVAEAMKGYGLDRFGYQYVNIDDCWAVSRDKEGVIVADPKAFPEGMKAVGDLLHAQGLKFGLYTDRGTGTCVGRPGSQGYEKIDAETYAKWGVDYLKEDSCNAPTDHKTAFEQYGLMRDSLNATGRPIYFALCGWSNWYAPMGKSLANSWRVGYDVNDWNSLWGNAISVNKRLAQYAGPGGFNDIDALIGSTAGGAVTLTETQSRTQFSLWAVMAAPLIIGSNMLHLSQFDLETYTNAEVIAVDQDPLGAQGTVYWESCPHQAVVEELRAGARNGLRLLVGAVPDCQQVWLKQLQDGFALAFVNYGAGNSSSAALDFDVKESLGWEAALVRDLWAHADLGVQNHVRAELKEGSGQSILFKLTRSPHAGTTVTEEEAVIHV